MSLKRIVKRVVQGTFEHLWSAGFRLLGRMRRPRPEIWSSPGGQRVLIVAPHPDDEWAGCVGAMLAHRRHRDRVLVCGATDGRRSRALGLKGPAMAAVRQSEMEAAARALDVELEWIGLPEGEWRVPDLERRLVDLLERFRPETIYASSRVDFHPEHEKVARALGRALAGSSGEIGAPDVRIYAVQVPLTSMLANLRVEVDLRASRLTAALAAYRSQRGSLEPCLRRRRYAGRLYRSEGGAETFWQVTAAQYQRLHAAAPTDPRSREFRGLRYYAWSDPLAYLRGLGERRRLKRWLS